MTDLIYTLSTNAFNKLRQNQTVKKAWQKINNTKIWGCASCLYESYGQPETVCEFYHNYIKDDEHKKLLKHYTTVLYNADGGKERKSIYFYFIIYHLFTETLIGCQREQRIMQMLSDIGFEVNNAEDEDDIYNGIDFIICKDNRNYAIQVKPISFFLGNKNEGLIKDRINAFNKEKNTWLKYNIPTYYIIYNGDEIVKNPNGKYCNKLADLINQDGTTKYKN